MVDRQEIRRRYNQAQDIFLDGRYEKALVILDYCNQVRPNNKNIQFSRAMCLYKLEKFTEAGMVCDHLNTVLRDTRGGDLQTRIQNKLFHESDPREASAEELANEEQAGEEAEAGPGFVEKIVGVLAVFAALVPRRQLPEPVIDIEGLGEAPVVADRLPGFDSGSPITTPGVDSSADLATSSDGVAAVVLEGGTFEAAVEAFPGGHEPTPAEGGDDKDQQPDYLAELQNLYETGKPSEPKKPAKSIEEEVDLGIFEEVGPDAPVKPVDTLPPDSLPGRSPLKSPLVIAVMVSVAVIAAALTVYLTAGPVMRRAQTATPQAAPKPGPAVPVTPPAAPPAAQSAVPVPPSAPPPPPASAPQPEPAAAAPQPPAPVAAPIPAEPVPAAPTPASAAYPPAPKPPVDAPRTIAFPGEQVAGSLFIRDTGSDDFVRWERFGKAFGSVVIPAGKEVRLIVDIDTLSCLRLLKPDDVHTLTLSNLAIQEADLATIKTLTGLKKLDLESTGMPDMMVEDLKKALPGCTVLR